MLAEQRKAIRILKRDLKGSLPKAAAHLRVDVSTVSRFLNGKTYTDEMLFKLIEYRNILLKEKAEKEGVLKQKLNKLYSHMPLDSNKK